MCEKLAHKVWSRPEYKLKPDKYFNNIFIVWSRSYVCEDFEFFETFQYVYACIFVTEFDPHFEFWFWKFFSIFWSLQTWKLELNFWVYKYRYLIFLIVRNSVPNFQIWKIRYRILESEEVRTKFSNLKNSVPNFQIWENRYRILES